MEIDKIAELSSMELCSHNKMNGLDMSDSTSTETLTTDIGQSESITMVTEEKTTEKSKEQLQDEVVALKSKLVATESTVTKVQSKLSLQQTRTKQLIGIWKMHLERNEDNLRRQGMEQDQQLGEVISQLLFFEGQLRKEQKRIVALLAEKEKIIDDQQKRIDQLAAQNEEILKAFNNLKQKTHVKNGFVPSQYNIANVLSACMPPLDLALTPNQSKIAKDQGHINSAMMSRFTAAKDRLRRHKSNLELRNIENTIFEETAEELSSSQENLATRRNNPRRTGRERCKSIAGYPLSAVQGFNNSPLSAYTDNNSDLFGNGMDHNMVYEHDNLSPESSPSNLEYSLDIQHHDSSIEIKSNGNSGKTVSIQKSEKPKKMSTKLKERLRSVSSSDISMSLNFHDSLKLASLSVPKSPQGEGRSSPISESNPFKTIKSMLKRKGSKLKKKRSVSLPQTTNMEYYEALQHHLEKEKKK